MNKQEGLVVFTDSEKAIIAVNRESACGGNCSMCNAGCNQKYKMEIKNSIGLSVGDEVILSATTAGVMLLAFISYIVPLIVSLAVYFFTKSEGWFAFSVLFGFFACILSADRLAKLPFFKTKVTKKQEGV